jgi:hypothetical protein
MPWAFKAHGIARALSGASIQVLLRQLSEPSAIEARIVACVHDASRQPRQAPHRAHIRLDITSRQLIEQRAIVDRIA